MKTVLITGANGFVGQNLIRPLLLRNYKVIATGKGESRLQFNEGHFAFETMDFTDENKVKRVFERYEPEIVVHSGAWSKPDDCELNRKEAFDINVGGTANLLQQADRYKSFFVFLSTDFIFDGEQDIYTESSPAGPVNYYGQTKLLAENEVKGYPWQWSIVRTVLVYGRCIKSRHNIVSMVAEALQNGRSINIVDDQIRTPTYVEDLAAGIVAIIEKSASGIFHLSGADILTPYQMACAVAKHLHLDGSLINRVTQESFQQPARRPAKTIFDITKAKTELDYQPVPFEEGLKRTFQD